MPKDEPVNSLSLAGFKKDLAVEGAAATEVTVGKAAAPTSTQAAEPTKPPEGAPPAAAAKPARPARTLDRKRDYAQLCPPNGNAHFMQDDGFFDFHGAEVPDPHKPAAPVSSDPLPSADELQNVHTNKIRALAIKAGFEWTGDRAAAIAFLTQARS